MRILRVVAVLIAACVLAACSGESSPTGTDGPVPMTEVYKSQFSGLDGRRGEVISRQSRWAEVWDEIHEGSSPKPALPAIDFERSILILGAPGGYSDACGMGRIESVKRVSGTLMVSVLLEIRTGCLCPLIAIHPVHVVAVPRAAAGASFEFRTVTLTTCE
jgi:hypothetical protein